MTRNSQRPAFVLVADLPQKSGPYTEPPPVARPWAVFVFDRSSPHSRFGFEISGTELKSIVVGRLKQLCVLPGPQDPALTAVIADMAVATTARAVAIQALI